MQTLRRSAFFKRGNRSYHNAAVSPTVVRIKHYRIMRSSQFISYIEAKVYMNNLAPSVNSQTIGLKCFFIFQIVCPYKNPIRYNLPMFCRQIQNRLFKFRNAFAGLSESDSFVDFSFSCTNIIHILLSFTFSKKTARISAGSL